MSSSRFFCTSRPRLGGDSTPTCEGFAPLLREAPWRPRPLSARATLGSSPFWPSFRRAVFRRFVRLALFDEDQAAGMPNAPPPRGDIWRGRQARRCVRSLPVGIVPPLETVCAKVAPSRRRRLDGNGHFVYFSCMPTRTITLELDAYEKLRLAKRGGESFTEVVRRAVLVDAPLTGEALRQYLRSGGSGVSDKYLDTIEEAAKRDPVPDDPWA